MTSDTTKLVGRGSNWISTAFSFNQTWNNRDSSLQIFFLEPVPLLSSLHTPILFPFSYCLVYHMNTPTSVTKTKCFHFMFTKLMLWKANYLEDQLINCIIFLFFFHKITVWRIKYIWSILVHFPQIYDFANTFNSYYNTPMVKSCIKLRWILK